MDKSVLRKALADNAEPTPGYLYRDIAQMTFVDQPTQQKLIDYLMSCLTAKGSVHVLAKTLKVIKVLCETGHADFQKEMQHRSDDLKLYSSYRGTMDPKFGDALNEKVRQAAKDAIDAAFTARRESKVNIQSTACNSVIEEEKRGGFSTGHMASTMPGGNEHMAPMPTTNKWAEHMARGGVQESQLKKDIKIAMKTGFGLIPQTLKTEEERMVEAQVNQSNGFVPVELPVGGGFSDAGPSSTAGSGTATAGEWRFGKDGDGSGIPTAVETKIMTPLQREVEKLCGLKSAPQRGDLSNFTNAVGAAVGAGATWEQLAADLDAKLSDKVPWTQRLNAMTAVEHLLKANVPIKDYFVENPEDVQRNIHVVQQSLADKSQKVLKLLGVPEKTRPVAGGSSVGATGATQSTNYGGNVSWSAPMPASSSSPAPGSDASGGGGGDLDFGSLTVKSRTAKEPVDKTKLRKRATMQQAGDEAQPAPPPQQYASAAPSGAGWGDGGGWAQAPTTTATTTGVASGGGWGGGWDSPPPTGGGGGSFGDASKERTPASAPPSSNGGNPPPHAQGGDIDSFFLGGTTHASPQTTALPPRGPPPIPAPNNNGGNTVYDIDLPQHSQPPAPSRGPATAPAPAAPLPDAARMMQALQMQMQQAMAVAAANPGDPTALQLVQQLMSQQQQLLQLMTAAQASKQSAPPPAGSYASPVGGYANPAQPISNRDKQFADLTEEMKRTLK